MEWKADEEIILPAGNSLFYVFTDKEIDHTILYQPKTTGEMTELGEGDWKVTFERTGKTIRMDELKDWTSFADDNSIRYYSGHASYETTFKRKGKAGKDERVVLDLGRVENIATVYVNGVECGTAWRAPYTVDITDAVKKGRNSLRIEVVNTWANACRAMTKAKLRLKGYGPTENIAGEARNCCQADCWAL